MRGVLGDEPPAKRIWRRSAEIFLAAYTRLALMGLSTLGAFGVFWAAGPFPAEGWVGAVCLAGLAVAAGIILAALILRLTRGLDARSIAVSFTTLLILDGLGMFGAREKRLGHIHVPTNVGSLLNGYAQGVLAAFVLITVLFIIYVWLTEAKEDIDKFGSSVSPSEIALVTIATPAIVAIAVWAERAGPDRAIPEQVGRWAIGGFVAACLLIAWMPLMVPRHRRSYRAHDGWVGRSLDVTLTFLGNLLSLVDYLLARPIAFMGGAAAQRRRGLWLIGNFLVAGLVLWAIPAPWGLAGALWAVLITVGLARRWSWVEGDRKRSLEHYNGDVHHRIAPARDLRDLVLTALALLVLFIAPQSLMVAAQSSELFGDASKGWGYLDCLAFLGGELVKAAPLVDWSEVYGVANKAGPVKPSIGGLHVIFVIRTVMDLVVITALMRAVSASTRLRNLRARFLDPTDGLRRLDPLVEPDMLVDVSDNWEACEELALYDENWLSTFLSDSGDWSAATAKGAARIAGWQFARAPLLVLITADPDEADEHLELRRELEYEAAEGVQRRADILEGAIPKDDVNRVVRGLRTPANQLTHVQWLEICAALDVIARRRRIEEIIRERELAPDERKTRLDEQLRDILRNEDPALLLQHLRSHRAELAKNAAFALRYVPHRLKETEEALIDALRSHEIAIRIAAARTLGRIGGDQTVDVFVKRLKQGLDAHYSLRALYRFARRGIRRSDVIAAAVDCLSSQAPLPTKAECIHVLAELRAHEALDNLVDVAARGYWVPGRLGPLPWSHSNIDFRVKAVQALEKIRDPRALEPLKQLHAKLKRRSPLRKAVAVTISSLAEAEKVGASPAA